MTTSCTQENCEKVCFESFQIFHGMCFYRVLWNGLMSCEAHLHAEGCNFECLLCCWLRINVMSSRNQKCT